MRYCFKTMQFCFQHSFTVGNIECPFYSMLFDRIFLSKDSNVMYDDCVLVSMRFPQKLWRIVNECKTNAIRWSANGGTILLDYKKFQHEYLHSENSIFKTNNITSFIRQLNLYGFRKVTSHSRDPMCNYHNPDIHEFSHEYFRADRMDMLAKVCRKPGGGRMKSYDRIHSRISGKRETKDKPIPEMTRLQMCQFALKLALQQATREYYQEKFWRESTNADPLEDMRNSQAMVGSRTWMPNSGLGDQEVTVALRVSNNYSSSINSGSSDDTSNEEGDIISGRTYIRIIPNNDPRIGSENNIKYGFRLATVRHEVNLFD